MTNNPSPEAVQTLEVALANIDNDERASRIAKALSQVEVDTLSARRLWQCFEELSETKRLELAETLYGRPVIARLAGKIVAEDPEPSIRLAGLGALLNHEPDAEASEWALDRLLKEPLLAPGVLGWANSPRFPLERFADRAQDSHEAWVLYSSLFSWKGRPAAELVRVGLDRHPKILTEIVLRASGNGDTVAKSILDPSTIDRLLETAKTIDHRVVAMGGLKFVETVFNVRGARWLNSSTVYGYLDSLSEHSSPSVREAFAKSPLFPHLKPETKKRLAIDPSRNVAYQALSRLEAPLLIEVARIAQPSHYRMILNRGGVLKSDDLYRVLYEVAEPSNPIRLECYEVLVNRDLPLTINGLVDPDADVRHAAKRWYSDLNNGGWLNPLFEDVDSPTPQDWVRVLNENIDQVREAIRRNVVDEVAFAVSEGKMDQISRLGGVGAIEELKDYCFEISPMAVGTAFSRTGQVGGMGGRSLCAATLPSVVGKHGSSAAARRRLDRARRSGTSWMVDCHAYDRTVQEVRALRGPTEGALVRSWLFCQRRTHRIREGCRRCRGHSGTAGLGASGRDRTRCPHRSWG